MTPADANRHVLVIMLWLGLLVLLSRSGATALKQWIFTQLAGLPTPGNVAAKQTSQ